MISFARRHTAALAGVLSAVSLALVFGAVTETIPPGAVPPPSERLVALVPHLNAAISAVAFVVVAFGWRCIRRGDVRKHRTAMVAGVALFAAFLALYLYRVVHEGPTPFAGPSAVARFVYYPILAVHILLAVVCVPLLYYVLLLAVTRPVREIPLTAHPRLGRATAALWLASFALGVVVYGLLYVAY